MVTIIDIVIANQANKKKSRLSSIELYELELNNPGLSESEFQSLVEEAEETREDESELEASF